MDVNELIRTYFSMGLFQSEILCHLALRHNVIISERTLKRRLKSMTLFRKKYFSPFVEVIDYVSEEIIKSGQNHGYKWMHLKCIQEGFVVTQETIRIILAVLDEEGVNLRKKRRLKRREYFSLGPNWNWHVDGYDKLSPYGLCISGCIDGFSRLIIWLRVACTNKEAKVVNGYFLQAVDNTKGIPVTVRFDPGTENVEIKRVQEYLARNFSSSSRPPVIVAKSTTNQRIESWWSILRKENAQYWITFFEKLKYDGNFTGDLVDKGLIQFCFVNLLQKELNNVVSVWNSHRIRRNKISNVPTGRPVNMYFTPEIYNAEDYVVPVPQAEIDNLKRNCIFLNSPCDEDLYQLCCSIIQQQSWQIIEEPYEAERLYLNLRRVIRPLLDLGY